MRELVSKVEGGRMSARSHMASRARQSYRMGEAKVQFREFDWWGQFSRFLGWTGAGLVLRRGLTGFQWGFDWLLEKNGRFLRGS